MADVVDLEDERLARSPHMTFQVRCVSCGHEWQAVVPVPVPHHMECSQCEWPQRKAEESKGLPAAPIEKDMK